MPLYADAGEQKCARIVSLAPSITETVFAVGLGERLVGVTSFCKYPAATASIPKIGGYYTPNYDAIYARQPSLVITLQEHEEPRRYLNGLGVATLAVRNHTTADVYQTIATIGTACGAEAAAAREVARLKGEVAAVADAIKGKPRPRVLVTVGKSMDPGPVKDLIVAGNTGFYDELIRLAGGENAYQGTKLEFPSISPEGLLRLNPDVIIDIVYAMNAEGRIEANEVKGWLGYKEVNAVKNGRIFIFSKDYAVLPGPRFVLTLRDMAQMIHPEAFKGR